MTKITYIPGEIANAAIDEHGNRKPVTRTQHIFDDAQNKNQADINAETNERVSTLEENVGTGGSVDERIAAEGLRHYLKEETYNKTELNSMITTPNQEYVTVATYASLPATGSADTVYRVSNYDGSTSQVDTTMYSEYAWDGTQYVFLCVKSQIGEVFDITAYNINTKYADLAAALGTNGANVPADLRKGGMSIKFVQSSDNKYVQYRLMHTLSNASTTLVDFANTANWQGVDDEPTAGSENMVKSLGVSKFLLNNFFVGDGNKRAFCTITGLKPGYSYIIALKNPTWDIDFEVIYKKFTVFNHYNNEYTELVGVKSDETVRDYYIITIPENSDYITIGGRATVGIKVYFQVSLYLGTNTLSDDNNLFVPSSVIYNSINNSFVEEKVLSPISKIPNSYVNTAGEVISGSFKAYVEVYTNISDVFLYNVSCFCGGSTYTNPCGLCFYDKNGVFLSSLFNKTGTYKNQDIVIPDGTTTIKVVGRTDGNDSELKRYEVARNLKELNASSIITPGFINATVMIISDGVIDSQPSANYKYTSFRCKPYSKYEILTTAYGSTYSSIIIIDESGNVVASYQEQTDTMRYKNFDVFTPKNAAFIFVNCRDLTFTPKIKEIYTSDSISKELNRLVTYGEIVVGRYLVNSNNIVEYGSSTGDIWRAAKIPVNPGDSFLVICTKYSSFYGWIITDSNNQVIAGSQPTQDAQELHIKEVVTMPANAAYLYVNNRSRFAFPTIYSYTNENTKSSTRLKIGSVNCGKFHYPESGDRLTPEQYKRNWRQMLNSFDYDIMLLSDFVTTFEDLQDSAIDVLFGNQYKYYLNGGLNANLVVVSKIPNIYSSGVGEVTRTLGDVTAGRYRYYKVVVTINNHNLAIYDIHLHPTGGEANTALRAAQYQDLINIINKSNEDAIIMGDFNAQNESEYQIFLNNGFKIGNCDYLGRINTLRNIPADNIVVTPNIMISKFDVIDSYELNTDHYPIIASLIV